MPERKNNFFGFVNKNLHIVCAMILILFAGCLLWFNNSTSMQAIPAMVADVYFDGEYRIGDGEWQKIVEGEHISSTKGDVTLRGNFHFRDPEGEYCGIYRGEMPVAFYLDHINVTIREGNNEPIVMDSESSLFGDSACAVSWSAYAFMGEEDEIIEIVIHNPHGFGNENAIDEMLSEIALWSGIDFEKGILDRGGAQRDIGLLFIIVSLMILGIALFSSLIHIKNNVIIWQTGLVVLFAGTYFVYSSDGISFWSESVVTNTTLLGLSIMLYIFFLVTTIVFLLKETQKIGSLAIIVSAVINTICIIVPIVTDILFYDIICIWVGIQTLVNIVISACLIKEFVAAKSKDKLIYIGALLPLIAFGADVVGIWLGILDGAIISKYLFIILFVMAVILILNLVPHNINAAAKAKELEMEKIVLNAELAESRISTMMSQIRPHFIYNTLGSIEQLCIIDPPKAGNLVHNFAKYLRGNFGELDNPKPILMSQEMEHVHYYISIENVRFPDMTFIFEMNSDDFHIPALTVQPIVENAIKHGLMKLPKGGTIHVVSYETETDYCISVVDDGVGFDVNEVVDERKHLGLRNIRERLKVMVNGTLEIESTVGVGTKVLIKIPKEVRE